MREGRRSSLDRLIDEAIMDAFGPAEQATGFYTMIEENVEFPIRARAVGEEVEVRRVDLDEDGEELVAICRRKGKRYKLRLTELEFPKPFRGREWIAAYFQFAGKAL